MESKAGWGRNEKTVKSDPWDHVQIRYRSNQVDSDGALIDMGKLGEIREETTRHARAVLRNCFSDGPVAAARAQAAYASWVHGVVESGGSERMPPDARRWSNFHDRWNGFLLNNFTQRLTNFSSIDGVDFSRALRRNHSRSRSF